MCQNEPRINLYANVNTSILNLLLSLTSSEKEKKRSQKLH